MIALVVITDGRRDCITQTIASAEENLKGPITLRMIYDDSGSINNYDWLRKTFPGYDVMRHPGGRQGFGGAIQTVWRYLALQPEPYIFHLEDDFTFNRPVNLVQFMDLLHLRPQLAQVALLRQPWNAEEKAAGGIIEQHPLDYEDNQVLDLRWLEHKRFFTTNPCLYPRSLTELGWPEGSNSEGNFGFRCGEEGLRFAFWGKRTDGPWVTHIGENRAGTGY